MEKTNFKQRQDAFKEWLEEAQILGLPKDIIKKVENEFFEKDRLIRNWEEEAQYFGSLGETEEKNLALDEAFEIHAELLEYLSLKKMAS